MRSILLVEDDLDIQEVNKDMLERRGGYDVRLAINLAEARERIAESAPDIIVLDIMLPDGSGLDFLRELREEIGERRVKDGQNNSPLSILKSQLSTIPVLLLTALGKSKDMVEGLQAGGDDYLAKPYDNDVLLARIEAILRRAGRVSETITKGLLTLGLLSKRAFVNGEDLMLTSKQYDLLFLLIQNEGKTMSAETVYEKVWAQPLNNNKNALQVSISKLRTKIKHSGYDITSLRGKGYAFLKI